MTVRKGGIIVPRHAHARFKRQKTAIERFREKYQIDPENGCWLWTSTIVRTGYAAFYDEHRQWRAHRWSYEYFVGAIPDGLVLDHLCAVRHCVNPSHLEAVTYKENIRRAQERQTHCRNGHPLSGENLALVRVCRTCRAAAEKRYVERKRKERQAA